MLGRKHRYINLRDLGLSDRFLHMIQIAQVTKEKKSKLDNQN